MFAARRFLWIFTAIIYIFESMLMGLFMATSLSDVSSAIFYLVLLVLFLLITTHSFYMAFIPGFAEGLRDIRMMNNQAMQSQYRGRSGSPQINLGNPYINNRVVIGQHKQNDFNRP